MGKGGPDVSDARCGPTIGMRRAEGVLQRRVGGEGCRRKAPTLLPGHDRDVHFVPTIVMRRSDGVIQRQVDGKGCRRKVPTLLPGCDQDVHFVPTIVMRQAGRVLYSGGARAAVVQQGHVAVL